MVSTHTLHILTYTIQYRISTCTHRRYDDWVRSNILLLPSVDIFSNKEKTWHNTLICSLYKLHLLFNQSPKSWNFIHKYLWFPTKVSACSCSLSWIITSLVVKLPEAKWCRPAAAFDQGLQFFIDLNLGKSAERWTARKENTQGEISEYEVLGKPRCLHTCTLRTAKCSMILAAQNLINQSR